MRIGKIESDKEYRMHELFQKWIIVRILIFFQIEEIRKFF